jgi:small subunit ribosomal protein S20
MADHKSAQKRHRQSLIHRDRNRAAKGAIRTAAKQVEAKLQAGDINGAREASRAATRLLDKAAAKGILHKNNARRHISRIEGKIATRAAAK